MGERNRLCYRRLTLSRYPNIYSPSPSPTSPMHQDFAVRYLSTQPLGKGLRHRLQGGGQRCIYPGQHGGSMLLISEFECL